MSQTGDGLGGAALSVFALWCPVAPFTHIFAKFTEDVSGGWMVADSRPHVQTGSPPGNYRHPFLQGGGGGGGG